MSKILVATIGSLIVLVLAPTSASGATVRSCSGGGPTQGFAYGDVRASPSVACRTARKVARRYAVSFADDKRIRGFTCSRRGESELMRATCSRRRDGRRQRIKFEFGS